MSYVLHESEGAGGELREMGPIEPSDKYFKASDGGDG